MAAHATSSAQARADRILGSLLLGGCGDALGAPFEGSTRLERAEVDRWLDDPAAPLRWTDDTAMTLVLARHLTRRGGTVEQAALAGEFAAEWLREPDRGYGSGAVLVLTAILEGTPWSQAAGSLFDGTGSYGNGAAMRVAPVGLVAGLGLSAVVARARRTAAVTHAHPLGLDGAAVQATAVAVAASTPAAGSLDTDGFLARVATHTGTGEFRATLREVAALVRRGTTPAQVADDLGNDVSALGSVPAALAAFLTHPDDPRAAIRFAVRVGGDTDTIAAMTGALCGARLGAQAVPRRWQRRLEASDLVATLADDLARLPGTAQQPPAGRPARSHRT